MPCRIDLTPYRAGVIRGPFDPCIRPSARVQFGADTSLHATGVFAKWHLKRATVGASNEVMDVYMRTIGNSEHAVSVVPPAWRGNEVCVCRGINQSVNTYRSSGNCCRGPFSAGSRAQQCSQKEKYPRLSAVN